MMKLIIKSLAFIVSSTFLMSCSSVYDKHVQWQTVKPTEFPVITAIGQAPISLQTSTNKTQKMLMAIKASKVAAYAELAEQVYGQQVSGNTTLANLVVTDQHLKASVQGVIRGAKVVKSYPVGDTYNTELVLDFKDVWDIYESSSRQKELKDVQYY